MFIVITIFCLMADFFFTIAVSTEFDAVSSCFPHCGVCRLRHSLAIVFVRGVLPHHTVQHAYRRVKGRVLLKPIIQPPPPQVPPGLPPQRLPAPIPSLPYVQ